SRAVLPQVAPEALRQVVRMAFGQRRKTLGNTLRGVLNADDIRACGIDPQQRAERLAPADFVRLAQRFSATRATPAP
ncbi:dimethyladenosine transferase, partial [mine drainage metagenome]